MEFNKAETEAQCVELPVCCISCELPTHIHTHTQHTQRQTPTLTLRRVRSSYAMLSQIWRQIYFASQLLQQTVLFTSLPSSPSPLLTHSLLFSLLFSQRPLHGCFTVGFLLFFLEIAVKNNKAPREFLALPSPSPSLSRCLPSFFRFLSTCLVFFKFSSASVAVVVELFLLFVLVMARPPPALLVGTRLSCLN